MGKKSAIPDRWRKYLPMGRQIPGTRFICFKTPLQTESVDFSPRTVMDHCTNLGLVIDLTNTTRYYDSNEFVSQGIRYAKLTVPGKKRPCTADFNKFSKIVCDYLRKNNNNDKVIGVHCTHGLNRTGYMVCRYMIQVLGIPPDQAIADFNSARGHEQEHKDYVENLRLAPWLDRSGSETPGKDRNSLSNQENSPANQNRTPSRHNEKSKKFHRSNSSRRAPWLNGAATPTTPATPSTPESSSETPSSKRKCAHEESPETPSWSIPQRKWDNTPSPYGRRKTGWTPRRNEDDSQSAETGQSQYYDQLYYGRVAPQYNTYYYREQGSGIGPHRPAPYWSRKAQQEQQQQQQQKGGRPRQYRGPRPYRSPWKQEEMESSPGFSGAYNATPSYSDRPRRHPMSPGAFDNVFSPATPGRRSARWRPY